MKRVGEGSRTAALRREHHHSDDSWQQVSSWAPPDDLEFALDPNGDLYNEVLEGEVMPDDSPPPAQKKKRSMVSVNCIARSANSCGAAEYRCEDCFLPDLTCASCCVRRHRMNPFHRIEKWSGSRFTKVSLKSLGLKIQLNHSGMHCDSPIPCHASMLVLHTNGIHEVSILYCGCSRAVPQHIQLLRRRLYPSSQITVKNCTTFELLRHLHELALTTKASTYDFYRALEKSTTNIGINVPKSRYRPLFRSILQWRHLKMLKWAGRGNDPSGVAGTKDGELGIRCPSCPWPGINLPDGWEDAPVGMKFLYMVFICMDANFRLKNQLVSNYSQDPGLGIGWAYMVPRNPYEKYVLSRANDQDISTCVGLQALAQANTRFSVGLRYTGVGATVCGRSEMILPLGVGNLQKGERYPNMDYIFGSVLRFVMVLWVLISYDIACQWFANLSKRIEEHWPEEIKPTRPINLIPAIPKLHEPMHDQTNHQVYSLNYICGAGHSDCECPERVWAPHNALGNSTKTQAPGSRHDVLDDHFGFWNWQKYIGLGATLLRKYRAAALDQKLVQEWEVMCVEWEEDAFPKKKKNPYHVEGASISEARVKKELAEEEEKRLAAGGISLHNTSAASFLGLGLEIEETHLTEQRNALRTRLRLWDQLVPIYMPGLLQYQVDRANEGQALETKSHHPEDEELWLPSRIPAGCRTRVCQKGLPKMEERLRLGQCQDSLENIRQVLRLKARMIQFKNKNIRGQREGLRSRDVIDRVHDRARAAAGKYRAARQALFELRGSGDWEETYRVLEDGDVRGYQDPNKLQPRKARQGTWEDGQVPGDSKAEGATEELNLYNEPRTRRDGTGETRRTLSWIWTTSQTARTEDEKDDIVRSEWAKSRARAARSREEVMLLKEEMRCVLKYLEWKSDWWKKRGEMRSEVSRELKEGLHAFAASQADVQEALASHFRKLWEAPLSAMEAETQQATNDDDNDNSDEDGSDFGDSEIDEDPEDFDPVAL
ncbi:hypothetical protein GALMADRAFT_70522 [Galerina marginata CBS 339.88]|uniref:CxC2-like cysteine cluster KDZ transposase-associated domain-containing protein n=1 Tax=Galerina marginata (strain CBS 339.88) TaxID=685588 RepID=A0A067T451_GALM3|nr:hypothetical protein GALMADRAFT_70522 [Galerina marginata CBS 339.88]